MRKRKQKREGTFFQRVRAWDGEFLSESRAAWAYRNRDRLLRAFPKSERAFDDVLEGIRSRASYKDWRILTYKRQKMFFVSAEAIFYADFYFKHLKLVIEIDGMQHHTEKGLDRDKWRTKLLSLHGIAVARADNDMVLNAGSKAIKMFLLEAIELSPVRKARLLWARRAIIKSGTAKL